MCRDLILNFYLPQVKIPELFLPNVEELVRQFEDKIKSVPVLDNPGGDEAEEMSILQDPEFRRNMSTVDLEMAVR